MLNLIKNDCDYDMNYITGAKYWWKTERQRIGLSKVLQSNTKLPRGNTKLLRGSSKVYSKRMQKYCEVLKKYVGAFKRTAKTHTAM